MEWTETAIIIGSRRHGETSTIAEIMTRSRGRWLGLVRGGRSKRMRPILQPGNLVEASWRARLDEHLGQFQLEPLQLRAAGLMTAKIGLYAIQTLASHLRLLAERDPHALLYDLTNLITDHLHEPGRVAPLLVRFELILLEELGFGLDLNRCVVSGATTDLVWVSPKSGCAVSSEEGKAWADKLLALPPFLMNEEEGTVAPNDLAHGFALTGHFLNKNVYLARGITKPVERQMMIEALVRS